MCFVSLVTTGIPNQPGYGRLQNWPDQQLLDLSEVLKRLDKIDQALGLRDCKDQEKAAFLKELEDRVTDIEKKLKKKNK